MIILGGNEAVSGVVEEELTALGLEVERVGGRDRYETAGLIAKKLPDSDTAVLSNGGSFPDVLAIGSHAARKGYPVLLTQKETIPEATVKALTELEIANTYSGYYN